MTPSSSSLKTLFCFCFQISSGYLKDLDSITPCIWRTGVVLCTNPVDHVPHSTTIKILKETTTNHSIPVINVHAQQAARQPNNQSNMAICLKSAFNQSDVGFLLQALDMKFSMGVDKIFTFSGYSNSAEVQEVLANLSGSSVQVFDWVLPSVINEEDTGGNDVTYRANCTKMQGQPLQTLDCQYRNMYLYKYLAVIDLDEFVYPMATTMNTVAMLDNINERNKNQVAQFVFFAYQSCYDYESVHGLRLRHWGHRGKVYSHLWDWYKFKSIVRPELVTYTRTHTCWGLLNRTFTQFISPTEGNLYHYRNKCSTAKSNTLINLTSEIRRRNEVLSFHCNQTRTNFALK